MRCARREARDLARGRKCERGRMSLTRAHTGKTGSRRALLIFPPYSSFQQAVPLAHHCYLRFRDVRGHLVVVPQLKQKLEWKTAPVPFQFGKRARGGWAMFKNPKAPLVASIPGLDKCTRAPGFMIQVPIWPGRRLTVTFAVSSVQPLVQEPTDKSDRQISSEPTQCRVESSLSDAPGNPQDVPWQF